MADLLRDLDASSISTDAIAQHIDDLLTTAKNARTRFERKWYDNNFFDDGYHYRYLQRTTNRIIDLSESASLYNPMRAIPKASRQIRGIANLLVSQDLVPVVYPEKVTKAPFPDVPMVDPMTGQQFMQPNPQFLQVKELAKRIAKSAGHWIEEEFKAQDMQEKYALMAILAAKHGVAYMQIWPDPVKEKIVTRVYDAFDIYLMGEVTEIYDSPFITKAVSRFISEIKADENFDPEQTEKLTPDNKYANSELKDAYMNARFGKTGGNSAPTLIQKETFLKEYLNEDNYNRILLQDDALEILEGKSKGDMIIRQVFSAGGVTLRDRYISLPEYPFVDFRYEPGPIYQVPLIERFIPTNKSLDAIMSRIEKYMHTSPMGVWMKRKGEPAQFTNQSGAQVVEYEATPPVQQTLAPLPGFIFEFIGLLNGFIDEQGVSLTTLNKVPNGVKAASAIESLKESEYANLVIANRRFRGMIKRVAERFLDLADNYFVSPQEVQYLDKGEPQYFDVIGLSGLKRRQEIGLDTNPNVVPLSKKYRVDIQVETGLGYTQEGKRSKAYEIMQLIMPAIQNGMIPPEAFKALIEFVLQTYGFGNTTEIIEAMDTSMQGNVDDLALQKMKVAMAEVIKDTGLAESVGSEDQRIMENKVGVLEALKDASK